MFWGDDPEFYHDKNGFMVGGPQIVDAIKNNLCGKVKRELVPGTLEVYALEGYGAVEIGVRRFLHPWAQDHGVVGEAKFIHVWRHKDGTWKITRVINIDHHEAKQAYLHAVKTRRGEASRRLLYNSARGATLPQVQDLSMRIYACTHARSTAVNVCRRWSFCMLS